MRSTTSRANMVRCLPYWCLSYCFADVYHRALRGISRAYLIARRSVAVAANPEPGAQPAQPSSEDLAEMTRRAEEVVALLKELRELALDDEGIDVGSGGAGGGVSSSSGKHVAIEEPVLPAVPRAPKRPWEDVSADADDDDAFPAGAGVTAAHIPGSERAQTAAEEDMALIRRKRATNNAQQGGPGTPKGKYRKRSVRVRCLSIFVRGEESLTFLLFLLFF